MYNGVVSYATTFLLTAVNKSLVDKLTAKKAVDMYKGFLSKNCYRSIEGLLMDMGVPIQNIVQVHSILAQSRQKSETEPIKGYKIAGKLGKGGTATVFKAINPLGKTVAIKILHPSKTDAASTGKFINEARLLTQFCHENIIRGLDYGFYNNLFYFAMELAGEYTLMELVEKRKCLEEKEALHYILEIAKGLEYIEKQGYVHKDIKPSNILLTKRGGVKLCDLGFAEKIGSRKKPSEYTEGTVEFMSPEQAQGETEIDIRSDIYSLGITLYYLVMGKLPFEAKSDVETMAMQIYEQINGSEIKNKGVSKLMQYFIQRMTSKDKDERFPSTAAMIAELTEHSQGYEELTLRIDQVRNQTSVMQRLSKTTAARHTGMQAPRLSTSKLKSLRKLFKDNPRK